MEEKEVYSDVWQPGQIRYYGLESLSICFTGELNDLTANGLISQLLEIDAFLTLHEAEIRAQGIEPEIKLYIDSPGGSLTSCFAVIDTIKSMNFPVIGIGRGLVGSAALGIFCACPKRLSYVRTTFFYHEPIWYTSNTSLRESKSQGKTYEYWLKEYNKILQATGITDTHWSNHFEGHTSYYFTAKQAKNYKFVQRIIKDKR